MLKIVPFGAAVFEKIFLNISLYITESLSPWGGAIHHPGDFI